MRKFFRNFEKLWKNFQQILENFDFWVQFGGISSRNYHNFDKSYCVGSSKERIKKKLAYFLARRIREKENTEYSKFSFFTCAPGTSGGRGHTRRVPRENWLIFVSFPLVRFVKMSKKKCKYQSEEKKNSVVISRKFCEKIIFSTKFLKNGVNF